MNVPRNSRLRIGNCSGFYGDRLSALREMLEGGPLDVLTGDYLAELTMLILGKDTMKDGLPRRVAATSRVRLCEHERSVGKTVGEVVEVPALVVEPVTDLLGSQSGQQ